MDYNEKMLIVNSRVQNNVTSYNINENTNEVIIIYENGETRVHSCNNVHFLESFKEISSNDFLVKNAQGFIFNNVERILCFKSCIHSYFRVVFSNGTMKNYDETRIKIKRKFSSENEKEFLEYYKNVSKITGMQDEEGRNSLESKYLRLNNINSNTVLSKFFNSSDLIQKDISNQTILFPFGCNLSQIQAVQNALANEVSIIEGPPGTGKTQTILNIIANLVAANKTVAIVSNNNSATKNIFEKLEKYGYSYISAELGNFNNKNDFINLKQSSCPDFSTDLLDIEMYKSAKDEISTLENELIRMLENKNRVAMLKQSLSSLSIEKRYFEKYFVSVYKDIAIFKKKIKISSNTILELWNECQFLVEQEIQVGLWRKLKYRFKYGLDSFSIFENDTIEIIPQLKKSFYTSKEKEIKDEIYELEKELEEFNFEGKMRQLSEKSKLVFNHCLARKFSKRTRKKFKQDHLWSQAKFFIEDYPVILSSTYSIISSLNGIVYDYLIVDEASQVDLVTGVLSMACAKNIVVVGDMKQLPNVITEKTKKEISNVSIQFQIPVKFRVEEQSLLSSISLVFKCAPCTLLKEHYRCHPKIIEFCNQKFYNGQLVVMTKDEGEKDVLQVRITSAGNHARDHFNQRQIDEIKKIIPILESSDLGIIAPYNAQTSELIKQLEEEIPISTVHKFQGRENEDIIISTVDNQITEFTDNPNMLNVAVSRAKNRLVLIISDNEENERTNTGDLVKYIKYNNFQIFESEVFSVFDMLYKCYEGSRKEYLSKHKKVSEYDSENLMYSIIEKVIAKDKFIKLGVVIHQPLNSIINKYDKLTQKETVFVKNPYTHIDFMIYNKIDKSQVLAVEVDGYSFHKVGTKQKQRDDMKDEILRKYSIPIVRFNTTESAEERRLENKLNEIL